MSAVAKSQTTAAWERRNCVQVTLVRCGGGVDAVLFEDSPHCRCSDPQADTGEFACDAAVAPCQVLAGHLEHELAVLGAGARAACWSGGLGPTSGNAASVPAQQGLWCDEPARSLPSGQGRRDRAEQGPVLVGERWPWFCRRKTASWRRSTTISRSFERPERTAKRAHDTSNRHRTRHIGPQDASASCLVSAHDHILCTHTHRGQPLKGHASDVPGDLANPGARVPAEKTLKRRCALRTRRPARTIQDMIAAGSRVTVRDQTWQLTEVERHAMGGRAVMRFIGRDELIRDCRAFAVRRTGCDEPSGRSQRRAIMIVLTLSRSLALLPIKRTRRAGE